MQSLDRACALLELLSRADEGLPVSELSRQMRLPMTSVHRFLKALETNGFVEQDSKTRLYRLGAGVLKLASRFLNANRLIGVARAPMQMAAESLGKVVYISQRHVNDVVCIACVDSTEGPQAKFAARIGYDMPFHAAAAAKIIFAYEPDSVIRAIVSRAGGVTKFTDKTKTTVKAILEDARKNREQGYAVCDEELEPGVIAVAAPIYSYDGSVLASVAVTGIKANTDMPVLIKTVCQCGQTISRAMGYVG